MERQTYASAKSNKKYSVGNVQNRYWNEICIIRTKYKIDDSNPQLKIRKSYDVVTKSEYVRCRTKGLELTVMLKKFL